MIEPERRQLLAPPLAADHIHQGRLRRNAELAQQRQQDNGLALAVAEASTPGDVGVGRDEAAEVHADKRIAQLVLHQSQRRLGPRLRSADAAAIFWASNLSGEAGASVSAFS